MNLFKLIFCVLIFTAHSAYANEPDQELSKLGSETLFVSLGSMCEPCHMLRHCELRKTAFPFDWIVSMDLEKLVELLDDDFKHFADETYLAPYHIHLLNTYYCLEFLHDGHWDAQYAENMQKFKAKYTRRIERFRQLKNYPGKVFFLRSAYPHSLTDPHRYFKVKNNLEISDEQSLKLYDALKRKFPELNFSLIILNIHDQKEIVEEKQLANKVRVFRTNFSLPVPDKIAAYKKFFLGLMAE